jgi:nucleoside-diphosphate-sugar epimerase
MKCVILGATGRLGQQVVGACVAAGDEVVAVTRGGPPPGSPAVVRWETLHPADVGGHHRLFAQADSVVDARNQRYDDWSRYPAMIAHTLTALEDTHAHYVYVDNLYLYGRPTTTKPVDEATARQPVSVKGQIRREIEQRLMMAMPRHAITIARFPDFYGISTDSLPRGLRWFGPPELAHQFIHIPDAAHAVRSLAEDVQTAGDVWHVTGADPITGYQLRDIAREVTGRATRLTVLSPVMVRLMGLGFAPARGLVETQYLWQSPVLLDATKFRTRFGTHFIHTHRDALKAILARRG